MPNWESLKALMNKLKLFLALGRASVQNLEIPAYTGMIACEFPSFEGYGYSYTNTYVPKYLWLFVIDCSGYQMHV